METPHGDFLHVLPPVCVASEDVLSESDEKLKEVGERLSNLLFFSETCLAKTLFSTVSIQIIMKAALCHSK